MSFSAGVELIVNLLNIHIVIMQLFMGRIRKSLLLTLGILVVLPVAIAAEFPNTLVGNIANALTFFIAVFLPLITIANVRKVKILFTSLFLLGIITAFGEILYWISSAFELNEAVLTSIAIIVYIASLIVCILISRKTILPRIAAQIELITLGLKVILIISVWLYALIAGMLVIVFNEIPNAHGISTLEVTSALLVILVGVMLPLLIVDNISSNYHRTLLTTAQRQMQNQVEYYELLLKADADLKKYRHDDKHLKIALSEFLYRNDAKGALALLEESDRSLHPDYIVFETGNWFADAILSEKLKKANEIGAKIEFDGLIPNKLINASDICTVLGNAIDNAIEACGRLRDEDVDRLIRITAYVNNGFLFLTLTNSVTEDVDIRNNHLPSTKKDKKIHGFGLYSIEEVIARYNGSMKISCKDNVFTLNLVFYLNSEDGDNKEPLSA